MTTATNPTPPLPFSPTAHQALRDLAVHANTGVTVVCGFPAAGKTTATRLLAELVDPIVLDKDNLRPAARGVCYCRVVSPSECRQHDVTPQVRVPQRTSTPRWSSRPSRSPAAVRPWLMPRSSAT